MAYDKDGNWTPSSNYAADDVGYGLSGDLLPSNYWGKVSVANNTGSGGGYAGLGSDIEQWNKRMDEQSALESALRLKQQYSGSSTPTRSGSYGTPAQYAQQMALDIKSLPGLSLVAPDYQKWNDAEEQAEVNKAANPMLRDARRNLQMKRASISGYDPALRRIMGKDAEQGMSDVYSKIIGSANQIGGQRYTNKLNLQNQQAVQTADIQNRMNAAEYAKKMGAIERNANLPRNADIYRYTDYV